MAAGEAPSLAEARARLVETLEREVRLYGLGEGSHQLDPRVRDALC